MANDELLRSRLRLGECDGPAYGSQAAKRPLRSAEWKSVDRRTRTALIHSGDGFPFASVAPSMSSLVQTLLDLHAAVLVAADAGLRRGEILGLHWEDVDLRSRRLTVRRSLWAGELTSPKAAVSAPSQ